MTGIDKLIYNELMSGAVVHFPGLGSLEPVKKGASATQSGRIAPPVTEIVFFPDSAVGRSVIDMLRDFGLDNARAEEIYSQWLVDSKETYDLSIGGVGRIKDGSFMPDDEFHRALNPHSEVYVDMKPSRKGGALPWILLVVVLIFAGMAYAGWKSGFFESLCGTVFPDTKVLDEQEISEVIDHQQAERGEGVDDPLSDLSGAGRIAKEMDAEERSGSTKNNSAADGNYAGASDNRNGSGLKNNSDRSEISKRAADGPIISNGTVRTAPAVRGRYYVVAGVFAVETNADNYIETYRKAYPEVVPEKIPFQGKTLVSIFSSDDGREAENRAARFRHRHYNNDLWVYKAD